MTEDVRAARRDRFEGTRRITVATLVIGGTSLTVAGALAVQFADQQASATSKSSGATTASADPAAPQPLVGQSLPTVAPTPQAPASTPTAKPRATPKRTHRVAPIAPPVQAPAPVYQAPAPVYQPPPPPMTTSGGS